MAAKKKAKRAGGPGRHPAVAYARVLVDLHSIKGDDHARVCGELFLRLPPKHRASDVVVQLTSVETLVPKGG